MVKKICGALTRRGKPCQKAPLEGRERCRLHGGKTPRGEGAGSFKHGLWCRSWTDAKKEIANQVLTEDLTPFQALAEAFKISRIRAVLAMEVQGKLDIADPANCTTFKTVNSIMSEYRLAARHLIEAYTAIQDDAEKEQSLNININGLSLFDIAKQVVSK